MKKKWNKKDIGLIMVVIGLCGMILILLTGCQEAETVVKPQLRDQLITLDNTEGGRQWKDAFGDNVETAQSFNLMLLNDAYAKFNQRLTVLEKIDPNSLKLRIEALDDTMESTVTKLEEIEAAIRHYKDIADASPDIKICDKPYVYRDPIKKESIDPNRGLIYFYLHSSDNVCTKHGRTEIVTFEGSDKKYCNLCMGNVARLYLDKHIRTDPNE